MHVVATLSFWLFFLTTAPLLMLVGVLVWLCTAPFDPERAVLHRLVCRWCHTYLRVWPGWTVRVEGRERLPPGPAVLVANHQSMADIFAAMGLAHPFKFVSKASLFRVPFVGWMMRLLRYVPLERGRPQSTRVMLEACRGWLRRGVAVLLFPEGTYGPGDDFLPFKRGPFRLAMEERVPVVPVLLEGTHSLVEGDGPFLRARARIRVRVLAPIHPEDFGGDEGALATRVRTLLLAERGPPPPPPMGWPMTPRSLLPRALRALAQWALLGALVGLVAGLASALFLLLLERATVFRTGHTVLVWALPLAGLLMGWALDRWGKPVRSGNNLVIDTVHEDSPQLPVRMAPIALLGTVYTHLFGGSAGREGTAVQMGASLADWVAHRLRVPPLTRRELLAAGIAGGFGSVFGTPIAGTVFGMEVLVAGRMTYEALLPALVAALVGDMTVRALGVGHTHYPLPAPEPLTLLLAAKWVLFAAAIALTAVVFVEGVHLMKKGWERWVPRLPLRLAAGGLAVVGLWQLSGTDAYLGLGVPTLLQAFSDPALPTSAFAWKLLFTAVTLSAGYLGGEVTPLFFVGAALGNVLARVLGLPLELAAGVGLASLFAAAANTPLALSLMAVELLGAGVLPHVVLVSAVAYLLSGHRGIYPAQRLARLKHGGPLLARLVRLGEAEAEAEARADSGREAPR